MQSRPRPWLLSGLVTLCCGFGPDDRSITGTGETLAGGRYEVGIGSAAYGVSDALMLRVPTLSVLVGTARAEARYKLRLGERWRLSPYASLETPRHAGAGADVGWDLGARKQHGLTAGLGLRYGPIAWPPGSRPRYWQDETRPRASFEYDFYGAGGDLFYAGVFDYVGYLGYTWAWPSFHAGLITSPRSGFFPFPYVYWRL